MPNRKYATKKFLPLNSIFANAYAGQADDNNGNRMVHTQIQMLFRTLAHSRLPPRYQHSFPGSMWLAAQEDAL